MIAHLKGIVLKKESRGIIVSTGNIGYFVYLTPTALAEIEEEKEAEFFTHHHVKEDHSDLFGFTKYEDLQFFQQLISVSGIGPKLALDILTFPQESVKSAILNEDDAFICKIPGIGKKTAKRMIIDLKDKITVAEIREYKGIDTHPDATDALIKLGYQRKEIIKTLENLPKELIEAEQIITYFLKNA